MKILQNYCCRERTDMRISKINSRKAVNTDQFNEMTNDYKNNEKVYNKEKKLKAG